MIELSGDAEMLSAFSMELVMLEEDRSFYVYIHRTKTDGRVFYVGKGRKYRATRRQGRSELWNRIADKYGYVAEIVKRGLTEKEAFDEEIKLIAAYDGLCNFTIGGGGVSGYEHTEDARKRISQANSGRKQDPELVERRTQKLRGRKRTPEFCEEVRKRNLGRKASEATKEKMRIAHTGRKQKPESIARTVAAHKGAKRSEEARRRMREAQPKRAVVCVETGDVFRSITEAAEWAKSIGYEKATKGAIWRRINCGNNGKTYGYTWKYHENV